MENPLLPFLPNLGTSRLRPQGHRWEPKHHLPSTASQQIPAPSPPVATLAQTGFPRSESSALDVQPLLPVAKRDSQRTGHGLGDALCPWRCDGAAPALPVRAAGSPLPLPWLLGSSHCSSRVLALSLAGLSFGQTQPVTWQRSHPVTQGGSRRRWTQRLVTSGHRVTCPWVPAGPPAVGLTLHLFSAPASGWGMVFLLSNKSRQSASHLIGI